MDKCEICGETSHPSYRSIEEDKLTTHLTKSHLYKLIAKSLDLVDRSFFSGEELADLAASYFGYLVVLVADKPKRTGWFSRAPTTMRYEAHPKPAKIVMPNGIIMWMTDSIENLPDDAPEYKVRKSSISFSGSADCPSCGSKITLDTLEEKNIRCPNCKKRYKTIVTDAEVVRLWSQKEFVDTDIELELEPI